MPSCFDVFLLVLAILPRGKWWVGGSGGVVMAAAAAAAPAAVAAVVTMVVVVVVDWASPYRPFVQFRMVFYGALSKTKLPFCTYRSSCDLEEVHIIKLCNALVQLAQRSHSGASATSVFVHDACGTPYAISNFAQGAYEGGWNCDQCRSSHPVRSERWFCESCSSNICFDCHPRSDLQESHIIKLLEAADLDQAKYA